MWRPHDADAGVTCSGGTPRRGKIIENGINVFERGENLLQNGIVTLWG